MNKFFSVAIDGPAGAGKSTVAKKVADVLNIEYIDTGAMFRAFTLKILNEKIDLEDINGIINIIDATDIDFINRQIYLDGIDVSREIRDNRISQYSSQIAVIQEVREKLLKVQRQIAEEKSVIMDGRDIGTVVLPNADYKFFITATTEERANRRYKELIDKGENNISLEEIELDIQRRDERDSNRKIAPLKQAEDAILIDTTDKGIDDVVEDIVSRIKGR